MKVAVISPYDKTPMDWLAQCIQSVRKQSLPVWHFIVCDGNQHFPTEFLHDRLQLFTLPVAHQDYGDTPRAVGSISAFRQGVDAVTWLDPENWYLPEHIEMLVKLSQQTGASICSSGRNIHHLDGSLLGPCLETDKGEWIDTNCYFVTKRAQDLVSVWWQRDRRDHVMGGKVLFQYLQQQEMEVPHTGKRTVCYRTASEAH